MKKTRNDFLTKREIKEKLVCLEKEKKLQKQRLKSLLNQVKNSQKNVLDRMGNANILNLLKQSINFYKKKSSMFQARNCIRIIGC